MECSARSRRQTKQDLRKSTTQSCRKKEFDDRAEGYKKALDEINKLNQQLDAPALSADAKAQKAKDRDEKIANIKNMEREINDFRQTREQQLQQQAMRMREGIVQEITEIVLERVKSNGMDLVLDKSGQSTNYVPVVLYSKDSADFTADIITALNKKAASASEKPATTSTSPATNPAKGYEALRATSFRGENTGISALFVVCRSIYAYDAACSNLIGERRKDSVKIRVRRSANIFSLSVFAFSAQLRNGDDDNPSSPPVFLGPASTQNGSVGFGFPGATADVRLTKPRRSVQLEDDSTTG